MSLRFPQKIKKALKPLARIISFPVLWLILLMNYYLFKFRKNSIPVFLVNLCINDRLVFKMDPRKIVYHIEDPDIMPDHFFVWHGDWDKKLIDIEEHEKIKIIKEMVVERKKYEDISFYSFAMDNMKRGEPLERVNILMDSKEKIMMYFEKQKKLFEKIKRQGFDIRVAPETGLVVTRDGNLIHYRQGHHTLAMARILGVENILVRVRAVHSTWLLRQVKSNALLLIKDLQRSIAELF
jgi:hypothetical protein